MFNLTIEELTRVFQERVFGLLEKTLLSRGEELKEEREDRLSAEFGEEWVVYGRDREETSWEGQLSDKLVLLRIG